MSDIVERLRRTGASGWTDAIHVGTDLELEAADEIERLREDRDSWKAEAHTLYRLLYEKDERISELLGKSVEKATGGLKDE